MSEEPISVSTMLRTTSTNTTNFLNQIADHIDKLEARIFELEKKLKEEQCNDENT
jgi:hypothetical protein